MHLDVLVLPARTGNSSGLIEDCEWRIQSFLRQDAYVAYDFGANYAFPPSDVVLPRHLSAVNRVMLARAKRAPWEAHFGVPISELEEIPPDLDLVDGEDDEVERGIAALARLVARLSQAARVNDMSASKVLHLLRPRFVAISDSYVRAILGLRNSELPSAPWKAEAAGKRMVAVQRGVRELALTNAALVAQLASWANSLPDLMPGVCDPIPSGGAAYRGMRVPIRLTKVRLLDILLWTEVAIRAGHSRWSSAWRVRHGSGAANWAPDPVRTQQMVVPRNRGDLERLTPTQVSVLAEHLARELFHRLRFEQHPVPAGVHGADFAVRSPTGRQYLVQVRSLRKLAYAFVAKTSFPLDRDRLLALALFLSGTSPDWYLIPASAWESPSALLVSRDYPGRSSEPEWGLNLSRRNLRLLEPFRADAIADSL